MDAIYRPQAIYRTPTNAPTEYICRRLLIPDDVDWLILVNGALGTLGITDFFTATEGGMTPEDTCAVFAEMMINSLNGCPEENTMALPIGAVVPLLTSILPDGMLYCDGASHDNDDYPELAAVLAPHLVGATQFTLPDMRDGRFLRGTGAHVGAGAVGGEATHTLTIDEMPAHSHIISSSTALAASGSGQPRPQSTGTVQSAETGGGQPHNNVPPYMEVLWAIVAEIPTT